MVTVKEINRMCYIKATIKYLTTFPGNAFFSFDVPYVMFVYSTSVRNLWNDVLCYSSRVHANSW